MLRSCSAIALVLAMPCALAQYKYVGSDGSTTYSDQPPPPGSRVVEEKRFGRSTAAPAVALPFAVQSAVSRYPVTLYTGDKCAPCEEGRTYLRNRGVPYAEKTVTSAEDIALFKQQSPDGTAPLLVVGSRKAAGFAQTTWSSLLDDAGYPPVSALPANFQNTPPVALSPATRPPATAVGGDTADATAAGRRGRGATPAPSSPPPADANPSGFRF